MPLSGVCGGCCIKGEIGGLPEVIMTRSLTARRCETARASSVAGMTEMGKATHVGNCGVGGGGDVKDFLKKFPNLNPFCLRSETQKK